MIWISESDCSTVSEAYEYSDAQRSYSSAARTNAVGMRLCQRIGGEQWCSIAVAASGHRQDANRLIDALSNSTT
jgi:hypothetical protein